MQARQMTSIGSWTAMSTALTKASLFRVCLVSAEIAENCDRSGAKRAVALIYLKACRVWRRNSFSRPESEVIVIEYDLARAESLRKRRKDNPTPINMKTLTEL